MAPTTNDAVAPFDPAERVHELQVDQHGWTRQPEVEERHEALPAGEQLGLVAVLGERVENALLGVRAQVTERRGLHAPPGSRPAARGGARRGRALRRGRASPSASGQSPGSRDLRGATRSGSCRGSGSSCSTRAAGHRPRRTAPPGRSRGRPAAGRGPASSGVHATAVTSACAYRSGLARWMSFVIESLNSRRRYSGDTALPGTTLSINASGFPSRVLIREISVTGEPGGTRSRFASSSVAFEASMRMSRVPHLHPCRPARSSRGSSTSSPSTGWWKSWGESRACPLGPLDQALVLQVDERLADRRATDGEHRREVGLAGKRTSRPETLILRVLDDRAHHLQVQRPRIGPDASVRHASRVHLDHFPLRSHGSSSAGDPASAGRRGVIRGCRRRAVGTGAAPAPSPAVGRAVGLLQQLALVDRQQLPPSTTRRPPTMTLSASVPTA